MKIFVVINSGGEYDDKWESVVVSSFDKTKCEKYIAEETEKNKKTLENCAKINEFYQEYNSKNPRPPMPNVKKIKWPSGLKQDQITDAMREERNKIQAENDVAMNAWRSLCEEHNMKTYSLLNEYKDSIGIARDFSHYSSNYDSSFYIEEIEVI